MGHSYSQQTLKVNTKMCSSRLVMMQNKKSNLMQVMRREIAEQLDADKLDTATIKVEGVLREKDLIVAAELLQQHVDRVFQRIDQISAEKKCPEDVFQSVATVTYCCNRMPIPEFKKMVEQFCLRYTKEWVMPLSQRAQYADPKVLKLIDVTPPSRSRIRQELLDISAQFNVKFQPAPLSESEESDEEDNVQIDQEPKKQKKKKQQTKTKKQQRDSSDTEAAVHREAPSGSGNSLQADLAELEELANQSPAPDYSETNQASDKPKLKPDNAGDDDDDDADDLAARFAALKKM